MTDPAGPKQAVPPSRPRAELESQQTPPLKSPAPNPGPEWSETFLFDFCAQDGTVGVWIAVTRWPALRRVWYWSALIRQGHPVVLILENDVPAPLNGTLEFRASGLWADHICEAPFEHWTAGLEAFGVAFEDPFEAYGRMFGDRVPVAYDLEWEHEPTDAVRLVTGNGFERYDIGGSVHGEILVGADVLNLEGIGQRSHWWGTTGWDHLPAQGWAGAHGVPHVDGVVDLGTIGARHLPAAGGALLAGTDQIVDASVGWSPVPIRWPDGRQRRMARALAWYRSASGERSLGWLTAFSDLSVSVQK